MQFYTYYQRDKAWSGAPAQFNRLKMMSGIMCELFLVDGTDAKGDDTSFRRFKS